MREIILEALAGSENFIAKDDKIYKLFDQIQIVPLLEPTGTWGREEYEGVEVLFLYRKRVVKRWVPRGYNPTEDTLDIQEIGGLIELNVVAK
jgi:hypothetical protein